MQLFQHHAPAAARSDRVFDYIRSLLPEFLQPFVPDGWTSARLVSDLKLTIDGSITLHLLWIFALVFAVGVYFARRLERKRHPHPAIEEKDRLQRKLADLEGTRPTVFALATQVLGPNYAVNTNGLLINAFQDFDQYLKSITEFAKATTPALNGVQAPPTNILGSKAGREAFFNAYRELARQAEQLTHDAKAVGKDPQPLIAEIAAHKKTIAAVNAEKVALIDEQARQIQVIADLRRRITELERMAPTLPPSDTGAINRLSLSRSGPSNGSVTIDG
jgi:hypothetical protein